MLRAEEISISDLPVDSVVQIPIRKLFQIILADGFELQKATFTFLSDPILKRISRSGGGIGIENPKQLTWVGLLIGERRFLILSELLDKGSHEHILCWRLARIVQLNIANNSRVLVQGSGSWRCHLNPGPLIFSHRIELADSDGERITSDYSEHQREGGNTPISEAAAFNDFAKSHKILLFLILLGVAFLGGFWLLFGGYHFAVRKPNLVYLLLCLLAGVLAFALVFAFAHASYAAQNTGSIPSSHISWIRTTIMTENLGAGCDPSRGCTFRNSAAERWSVSEATMGAGEVVVVEPGEELLIAFFGVGVGADISPLAKSGLKNAGTDGAVPGLFPN
jgi:hypothetical protein